jgi:hypothetical protein
MKALRGKFHGILGDFPRLNGYTHAWYTKAKGDGRNETWRPRSAFAFAIDGKDGRHFASGARVQRFISGMRWRHIAEPFDVH